MPTEAVTLTQVVLDSKEHFAEGTEARPVFRTQLVTLGHMTGHMTGYMTGQMTDYMTCHMTDYMTLMTGHLTGHMTGHRPADELDPHRVPPAEADVPSPELGEHA